MLAQISWQWPSNGDAGRGDVDDLAVKFLPIREHVAAGQLQSHTTVAAAFRFGCAL